jgi:hypothetical protein
VINQQGERMRHQLTSRSNGRILVTAAVAAGALLPVGDALARGQASDAFFGTCQVQGVTTVTDAATGAFRFAGTGACIGLLNGKPVAGASLRVAYGGTATVLGGLLPVTGSGKGVVTLSDPSGKRKYRFPFTAQQVGTVLTATCRGGGSAVAALVPTQPPSSNATTVQLAGVLQTLTPCRS